MTFEVEVARLGAVVSQGFAEIKEDVARIEDRLEGKVSISTQAESLGRLYDRIESLQSHFDKRLDDLTKNLMARQAQAEKSAQNAMRLSVTVLVVVLTVVLGALYAGTPG